jgi:small subunit ribosomal protein S17
MAVTEEQKRGVRKTRTGVVVSDAMSKTIIVRVERKKRHPLYGKEMRQFKKFYAHDEENKAKVGDKVRIEETRPLSRLKRWRLVDVLEASASQEPGGSL